MTLDRPFVLISSAISLDGCLDDCSPQRLMLSNEQDLEEIDALRADYDAIMVGAGTLRADNPRLLLRSPARRAARAAAGRTPDPLKVTFTLSGNLSADLQFFADQESQKLVYCPAAVAAALEKKLGSTAHVIPTDDGALNPDWLLHDLASRGIARLIIEGGERTNSMFLRSGQVDALRLGVAPFFVAEPSAPRLVSGGRFGKDARLVLTRVEQLGDMAVLWYETKVKEV